MTNNYLMQKLTGYVAAAVAIASFAAMPALAQTSTRQATTIAQGQQIQTATIAQGQQIQAPTVNVQINPSLVRVNRRQPVAFKAFDLRDPRNGNAVAPTAMITLANGKQMTAQQYYAELNKLEQQFNAIGYSMRDPQQKIELQQLLIDQPALDRQIQNLRVANPQTASLAAPGAVKLSPQVLQTLNKEFTLESQKDIQRTKILGGIKVIGNPNTVHTVKSFNYTLGNTSTFAAFANGKLDLTGKSDLTTVYGEANAGGSVLGNSKNIFRVTGQVTAPKTGTMNGKLTFAVLGINVYNLNQNTNAAFSKSDSLTKSFDWNTSATFTIGPIPVKVKVGAKGNAGVAYFVSLRPVAAKASLSPTANASIYAQAGVDILIASAGVGASMTLIDGDLNLGGEIAIIIEGANAIFYERFYACVDLHMLKGKVYVYAEVDLPWPLPDKEWQWTLWNWSGYHNTSCLFNTTKKTPLYSQPVLTTGQIGMVK
ncbi:MAG: hypothetical protein MOB07_30700 [Acidobacteria bacterium]|nr:hypothetical protein [Acidobacteriota bacterium]